jgi:hypothetical protein
VRTSSGVDVDADDADDDDVGVDVGSVNVDDDVKVDVNVVVDARRSGAGDASTGAGEGVVARAAPNARPTRFTRRVVVDTTALVSRASDVAVTACSVAFCVRFLLLPNERRPHRL